MRSESPSYGMERTISQVSVPPSFTYKDEHSITDPYGRPGCYKKMEKLCGKCPWKSDCINAEGRS